MTPTGLGRRGGTTGAAPSGLRRSTAAVVRAARPKQWLKNVLVFAAPAAAGVLTHGDALLHAVAAFALFSAGSSAVYLVNDVADADADRLHPIKRLRPVASGELSKRVALSVAAVLLAVSLVGATLLWWELGVVIAVYAVVQVGYSFWLKHVAVYDLAAVAGGFVLRAIAGGVAVRVPVSEWFLIVATFGSLLMVTGKRLAELSELGEAGRGHRRTLARYSPAFLRTVLAVAVTGAILGYCEWAFALETAIRHHDHAFWFQLSIVPMLIALLRYTYLVERGQGARPEDLVTTDRSMVALGAVWLGLFALGVYAS